MPTICRTNQEFPVSTGPGNQSDPHVSDGVIVYYGSGVCMATKSRRRRPFRSASVPAFGAAISGANVVWKDWPSGESSFGLYATTLDFWDSSLACTDDGDQNPVGNSHRICGALGTDRD